MPDTTTATATPDTDTAAPPPADWVLSDNVINTAVGTAVRRAREAEGHSRPDLAAILPFPVTAATLLNWELGKRAISYSKLVEVARVLNTTGPALLAQAIELVEVIDSLMVDVDLEPLCADQGRLFKPVRTWARNKRATLGDAAPVVRVHHSVIRELAVLAGVPLVDLVARHGAMRMVR